MDPTLPRPVLSVDADSARESLVMAISMMADQAMMDQAPFLHAAGVPDLHMGMMDSIRGAHETASSASAAAAAAAAAAGAVPTAAMPEGAVPPIIRAMQNMMAGPRTSAGVQAALTAINFAAATNAQQQAFGRFNGTTLPTPPAFPASAVLPSRSPMIKLYRDGVSTQPSWGPGSFLGMQERVPLYALSYEDTGSTDTDTDTTTTTTTTILHAGPTPDHPRLAALLSSRAPERRAEVTLAPLPGQDHAEPVVMTATMRFHVEVPWPGTADGTVDWRSEAFEWRRAESLRAGAGPMETRRAGWRLVRLSDEEIPGDLPGKGTGPRTRDQHEVVGACESGSGSSLGSELWSLCFFGTGSTGGLGERFAAVALATGLVTLEIDTDL